MRRTTIGRLAGIAAVAGAIAITGCGGGNGDTPAPSTGASTTAEDAGGAPTGTLVVDTAFVD